MIAFSPGDLTMGSQSGLGPHVRIVIAASDGVGRGAGRNYECIMTPHRVYDGDVLQFVELALIFRGDTK